jgi:zinc protease
MFEGSEHVPEGSFDSLLESAGGDNNGSTSEDRTNYVIDVPSNALELALYLESDRMGFLLPTLTQGKLDGQRDVVKNEKRQRIDNAPYGQAFVELAAMMYPEGHPYSWPVIGSMDDLSAATLTDVTDFFKSYYTPNNASLVVAGDIEIEPTRKLVEKWFGGIPRGPEPPPPVVRPATLSEVKRRTIADKVQLPRLYMAWHTPGFYAPGDAAMDMASSLLSGGKNSRLYRRLVYDMQVAQDVTAAQMSRALGGMFVIVATARPGQSLEKIQAVIDEEVEKLKQSPPDEREMTRALNQIEASFYRNMERTGSFGGKADLLNGYYVATGMPDYFEEDLARYRAISPNDVQSAAGRYLPKDRRVELIVTGAK